MSFDISLASLTLSGYQDSNLGPSGPKPDALTGLRYIPLLYCECKGKAKNLICKFFLRNFYIFLSPYQVTLWKVTVFACFTKNNFPFFCAMIEKCVIFVLHKPKT